MVMKSARVQSLWQTLTTVCRGIGKRNADIYAQGKIWVAERQLGEATRRAGQRIMASWHGTSWQALALQYKGLLVGIGVFFLLLAIWKIPQ